MKVPFLSLKDITDKYSQEIHEAVSRVIDSGWYLQGEENRRFEEDFARYIGTRHAIGCANGLDALIWILRGYIELGIMQEGDEVIVPANTFIASILAITENKLVPVLVEPSLETLQIDDVLIEEKITPKTKMIVPVHIGGYPVDMDPIMELAAKHDIVVLEDGAHAFGGEYKGKKLGTIGHFGAFSFHEVKNMTSFGEGGILTTTIEDFRADMKRARFLGADFSKKIKNWLYDVCAIPGKDGSSFVATNFSTTEIQGLGLQLQLSRYDKILEALAAFAAEQQLTAHAGLGCPMYVTKENILQNIHVQNVQNGYPGGCGTPRWALAVASSPESSRPTEGPRV